MARAPFGNFVAGLGPNMRRQIGNTIAGAANPMTQSGQMGTMNNFNMTPMGRGGPMPTMGRPAVNKPPMFGGGAPPQWMPGAGGGMTNPNIPGPGLGAGGPAPMGGGGSATGGTGMTNPNIPGPGLGAGGPAPMGQGFNGPPLGAGGPNPMIGVPSGSTGGADPYAGTGGGLPPVDPYAGTGGGSPVYQPPGTGGLDPLPQTPTTGGEDPVFNPYGGTGGGLPPANPLNKGGGGGRNPFRPNLTQFGQRPALPPMRQMQRNGPAAGDTYGSPNSGIGSGGSWDFNEGRPGYDQGGAQSQYGGRNDFYSSGNSGGPGYTVDYSGYGNNPINGNVMPENGRPARMDELMNPAFYQSPQQFAYSPFNGPIPGQKPAIPAFYGPPATPYKGKGIGGPVGPAVGRGTPSRGGYSGGYGAPSAPTFGQPGYATYGSDPEGFGGNGSIGGGFANGGYNTPGYGVNPTTAWNEANTGAREGFTNGDPNAGGGGKIVCTAMNEAYGFGSFRQAIWLKHSAGLDPAYQRGYHAMFVPLLRYARGGQSWPRRLTWRALQHIARHRTADIWLQSKGAKRDTLGRVYRALLEPLCFVVGKIRR
jgi:hypothetical protein